MAQLTMRGSGQAREDAHGVNGMECARRGPMRRFGIGIVLGIVLAGAACGGLPRPTYVPQKTEDLQQVEYPPPPARVEFIPDEPKAPGAVWIDGEWTWQGRRWAWKPGRWIATPAGASFSPWTSVRDPGGLLYVAEGKWRDAKGQPLPDPVPLAVGKTRGGTVTDPDGDNIPAAPNAPPQSSEATGVDKDDGGRPQTPSGATPTGTEAKASPAEASSKLTEDAGATLDAGAD
jgi:hypothetical protein